MHMHINSSSREGARPKKAACLWTAPPQQRLLCQKIALHSPLLFPPTTHLVGLAAVDMRPSCDAIACIPLSGSTAPCRPLLLSCSDRSTPELCPSPKLLLRPRYDMTLLLCPDECRCKTLPLPLPVNPSQPGHQLCVLCTPSGPLPPSLLLLSLPPTPLAAVSCPAAVCPVGADSFVFICCCSCCSC